MKKDLQAKTEGLKTFYNDFVNFQQNLAYYLDHKWENHYKTQENIIKDLQNNSILVEERLKNIMNGIQAIYDKPIHTNQVDLDTPHILMYVDRIDKNV